MNNPNLTFQSTPVSQVEKIQQLARKIWPDAFGSILSPEQITYMMEWMYGTEQLQKEIRDEGIRYELIFKGNSCCGYVAYGPGENDSELKLHKVYIDPSMQRQGIGQTTLKHVCNYARDKSFQTILLRVNRHNTPAIQSYKKYGFTIRSEDVADIGNGYVMDDYIMEYLIPPPKNPIP